MQRQDSNDFTTLDMVAAAQRRNIVRDRLVGAFLALGLLISVTTIESMARTAQAPAPQEPVMLASALIVNIEQ